MVGKVHPSSSRNASSATDRHAMPPSQAWARQVRALKPYCTVSHSIPDPVFPQVTSPRYLPIWATLLMPVALSLATKKTWKLTRKARSAGEKSCPPPIRLSTCRLSIQFSKLDLLSIVTFDKIDTRSSNLRTNRHLLQCCAEHLTVSIPPR